MRNAFQSVQMQYHTHLQRQFPNVQTLRTVWHSSLRGPSCKVPIGVTISNDLGWSTHVDNITKKSSNTLNFWRRNLKYCPKQSKEVAYFTMVRSTLEYSSAVWDPNLQKSIDNVERVNRSTARFVLGDHRQQSGVSVLLENLQSSTLEHRRKNQRLTTMFKIVHGLIAVPTSSLISADSRTRCNHPYKFKCILASTTAYKNFFPRTIPQWNDLDKETAEATTINCFKCCLHQSAAAIRRLDTPYCELVDYVPDPDPEPLVLDLDPCVSL